MRPMRAAAPFAVVAALGAAVLSPAHAAAARPASPAAYVVWSPDGRHCAELDPQRMETRVFAVDPDGARRATWSMNGWFQGAALANDGDHLVVSPDEIGLVRADYDPGDALVVIYDRGYLVRAVPLSEVVAPADLIRRDAWFLWGHPQGFDARGRFVLATFDGDVPIDVRTGRRAR